MVDAIITEERIFKSSKNVRSDLTTIKKATESSNITCNYKIMYYGDNFEIQNVRSYLHIHSNDNLTITLMKNNSSITLNTQLLTTSDSFDSVVIKYEGDLENSSVYIIYS